MLIHSKDKKRESNKMTKNKLHPQGYKYTYAKVMHKRLAYMDGLKIFKTDVTASI